MARTTRLWGILTALAGWSALVLAGPPSPAGEPSRLRVVIETDAGGDPDDEQSLVRLLLHANEWDVDGIIANRPLARDRENLNPARTGLGIVQRLLDAYAVCYPQLVRHDSNYPAPAALRARTVPGYDTCDDGVRLLLHAIDSSDPRPLWYSDWGSDRGAATNNLRRALDRVRGERTASDYARFKQRVRLSSADGFGPHTAQLAPAFSLWVNTFGPELEGRRWYHRFSALTAHAGGFDLQRDVLVGHGPLGALYPTNTTHPQKEGDTMSFLRLLPVGLGTPDRPHWGGWGGRYGHNPNFPGKPYFWANQSDTWNGTSHRDNTLARYAIALQNEFRARLDWCVRPFDQANHPPQVRVRPRASSLVVEGETVDLDASASSDPDGDTLGFAWSFHPEPSTYQGALELRRAETSRASFVAPAVRSPQTVHLVLEVSDHGTPALSRYARLVFTVLPTTRALDASSLGRDLAPCFKPPAAFAADYGAYAPVLTFEDGRPVERPADWAERRAEILAKWHRVMGPWPPLIERPRLEVLTQSNREDFVQERVAVELAPGAMSEGWLLFPRRTGRLPAVLVPFYEPETSIGLGKPLRDFAYQLTKRGFVTLSIGSPGGDARRPDLHGAQCQPLSFLAYLAANACTLLQRLPQVDAGRVGILGHSYGGKWAMFAACLHDGFAAGVWSDPGVAWDESRPNVNYWEPWYLGFDERVTRQPGGVTTENPRTGAYRAMVETGMDLHELQALMAPRPFLVSGGSEDPPERWRALNHAVAVNRMLGFSHQVGLSSRPAHEPTPDSNGLVYEFLIRALREPR